MKEFSAGASEDGQRLDKFLKKLLPGAPLSLIYKLSRTNRAKVDWKKRENDFRLEEGQTVKIFLSDAEFDEYGRTVTPSTQKTDDGAVLAASSGTGTETGENASKTTKFRLSSDRILFEDAHFLAVNKPAGLNVHPGDHKSDEVSLIEAVSDYYSGSLDTLTFRPSLVHRIDRDTSGIVLIAKTKRALDRLLGYLQRGKMEKTYAAVVVGNPKPASGTINKKLLRVENAKGTDKVRVDPAGQPAITHFALLESSKDAKYALLEVRIETGRTHQIRVHLASIGHPVLGDKTYGSVPENSFAKRSLGIARQQLHAWKLSFPHPETGETVSVECPFEPDTRSLFPSKPKKNA